MTEATVAEVEAAEAKAKAEVEAAEATATEQVVDVPNAAGRLAAEEASIKANEELREKNAKDLSIGNTGGEFGKSE
jgi:peptidoglycan hydrolase CwlO-like protein